MTSFLERYMVEDTWYGKAAVMEIYHLTMCYRMKSIKENWTVMDTSKYFEVSVGLVSENLQLAEFAHLHPKIVNCKSRQEALKKLKSWR